MDAQHEKPASREDGEYVVELEQEGAQPHDQAAGEQGLQVTQADDLEPLEQLAEDTPPTGSDWEVMSPPVPSRSTTPRPEEQQAASTDAADSLQHIPIVDEQSPAADAAEQAEQASQHSRPGSETSLTGGRWQLTGDSDHDQESAFSDLESELDRASSPSPSATLSALRLTSQHHGHGGASSSQPPSSPAAASQLLVAPSNQPSFEQDGHGSPASSSRASDDVQVDIIPLLDPAAEDAGPAASVPAEPATLKHQADKDSDGDVDELDEEAGFKDAAGRPRPGRGGLGATAAAALRSAWVWLQDLISSVRSGVPMPVRQATARAAAAAGRLDRTVVLGTGVAVLGGLLAAAVARNHRLSHALRDKDRDMTQLVMKVFNLQHTLQSSRNIPIVRHTSSTCSFSFAGGGMAGV